MYMVYIEKEERKGTVGPCHISLLEEENHSSGEALESLSSKCKKGRKFW
jgi:hypothetical protein